MLIRLIFLFLLTSIYATVSYGNINRQTDSKNTAQTQYTYDLNSQKLLSQTGARPNTLTTDPNGNVTQSYGKTYNFDPDRRLGNVTQGTTTLASYQYDHLGRRVGKTTSTGTANYDYDLQGQLLVESAPGQAATYVYLDKEPLARVDYNLSDTTEKGSALINSPLAVRNCFLSNIPNSALPFCQDN